MRAMQISRPRKAPAQAAAEGARLSFASSGKAAPRAENRHSVEQNRNWIEGPGMGSEDAAVA